MKTENCDFKNILTEVADFITIINLKLAHDLGFIVICRTVGVIFKFSLNIKTKLVSKDFTSVLPVNKCVSHIKNYS